VTLAIFAALGPAIGAFALGLILTVAQPQIGEAGVPGMFLYAAVANMPLAYVAGGVQAIAAGAATAGYALHFERSPPWQVPFFAAGIAGLIYMVMRGMADVALLPLSVIAAHLVAGVACWLVASYLLGWRRSAPAA
jgi:hypothetical protein